VKIDRAVFADSDGSEKYLTRRQSMLASEHGIS